MAQAGPNAAAAHARTNALFEAMRAVGLQVAPPRPIDFGEQLVVRDGTTTVTINVYGGKSGVRVVTGGAKGTSLFTAVSSLIEPQLLPAAPAAASQPQDASGRGLQGAVNLRDADRLADVPGRHPAQRPVGVFPPPPWIGSDESGKGDYFGPLVAAAVYVEGEQEPALRRAGVQDSKLLDDATARRVAREVRRLCAGRFAEELLPPDRYNVDYAHFRASGRNLNHLLARGHVQVIAALIAAGAGRSEPLPAVIADKFADERLLRDALQEALSDQGLPLPALVQTPRAEANVAVAAASILARDRFLDWLGTASDRFGVVLPKGGSKPSIIAAARRIAGMHGDGGLAEVAKLHFATTKQVSQRS